MINLRVFKSEQLLSLVQFLRIFSYLIHFDNGKCLMSISGWVVFSYYYQLNEKKYIVQACTNKLWLMYFYKALQSLETRPLAAHLNNSSTMRYQIDSVQNQDNNLDIQVHQILGDTFFIYQLDSWLDLKVSIKSINNH